MAVGSSIVLDYELIQTGTRSRTSLINDRLAVYAENGVSWKSSVLNNGNIITFNGVTSFFFLKCNGPLQVKMNRGSYFLVTSFFAVTAAIDEISIFNNTGNDVNCLILDT